MTYTSIESVVEAALDANATDVHCYSSGTGGYTRFRVHGALTQPIMVGQQDYSSLISTLKLRAGMDIASTTIPQDGHIEFAPAIDLRISTLPTSHGEDCAIRILNRTAGLRRLNELGLSTDFESHIRQWAHLQSGLILVTGATGSGKTTTLYAIISEILNIGDRCVVTLEDPIEYPLPGARQSPVKSGSAHTFSTGLRAVLRQDPDVIMIGEIRDRETAQTALEAAYTGHLVLSTLHTASIELTIQRMAQFSLDPFWLSQSIQGIVSQSLTPRYCPCGVGCVSCQNTGRIGRQLNAELVSLVGIDDRSALISGSIPEHAVRISSSRC